MNSTWEYLHMWREKSGLYRCSTKGGKGTSKTIEAGSTVEVLNFLGEQGWELVNLVDDDPTIDYIFKRPKVTQGQGNILTFDLDKSQLVTFPHTTEAMSVTQFMKEYQE